MPKRPARTSDQALDPVQRARDAADGMYRAAAECCRQHDRVSRVHGKSNLDDELAAAQRACEHCNEALAGMSASYEQAAAGVHPTGTDAQWWHRANALWLASREYLRRNGGADRASRDLKSHDRDRLGRLHFEFELEASALLALRHAAEGYQRERPGAA